MLQPLSLWAYCVYWHCKIGADILRLMCCMSRCPFIYKTFREFWGDLYKNFAENAKAKLKQIKCPHLALLFANGHSDTF